MFDRIAPVYDVMNRVMTAGLDQRLAAVDGRAVVRPGDEVLDACCGTGDLAHRRSSGRAASVTGLDFSERDARARAAEGAGIEWVRGDLLALPFADASFDAATVGFGVRNVADLERALAELRRVLRPGRPARRSSRSRARAGSLRPFYRLWFDGVVPLLASCFPAARRTRICRRACAASRAPRSWPRCIEGRLRRRPLPAFRGRDRRAAHGGVRDERARGDPRAPGLDAYLGELEERLDARSRPYPGVVGGVGAEALAAGGKRLRPLLVFLCAPAEGRAAARRRRRGRARAPGDARPRRPDRRRRGSPRARLGLVGARRRRCARATGDYLFARAFAELAATATCAVAILADAALCLARGEAMQRRQRHDPDTTVEAYLERCALKTAKLFEAACRPRRRRALGRSGSNLGIAFQIADDILDCTGHTIETGKLAGTDLRDGTPTLPLILAAQEDELVRRRSRAARSRARSCGSPRPARWSARARRRSTTLARGPGRASTEGSHREELESLADAVVNRRR